MTSAESDTIENVTTAIHRLMAVLTMIGLATEMTANMDLIERAIAGAADFAETIKDQLDAMPRR